MTGEKMLHVSALGPNLMLYLVHLRPVDALSKSPVFAAPGFFFSTTVLNELRAKSSQTLLSLVGKTTIGPNIQINSAFDLP